MCIGFVLILTASLLTLSIIIGQDQDLVYVFQIVRHGARAPMRAEDAKEFINGPG